MKRRSSRRWQGEAFGTSLADILTTALGCVLLMFLVAVMHIRTTLADARNAHDQTRTRLAAEEEGRVLAEREKQVERGKRRALEQAIEDEAAARGQAQRALRAANERLSLVEKALVDAQGAADGAREQYHQLREAASLAVTELDPRTASPVDVMVVLDGTRSMKPSLDATRRNLRSALGALRVVSPTARVGVVVYRDKREPANLRLQSHPLTGEEQALAGFLDGIEATSTRVDTDRPEWLCGGMEAAAGAGWREGAIKLMIIATDAASQDRQAASCLKQAARFRERGGRVYVLSTLPRGYGKKRDVSEDYDTFVLPQHAAIAQAGGGVHVQGAESDALLNEVLRAAFRSRTAQPLDDLKKAVDQPTP